MRNQPVLQPHVVCLGNPVAGNPTQFVMSRAAKELGLDWRFFTAEVAVPEFEVAVRGVQALGLQGMVLLEPFQQSAIPLLDTVTASALHLNRVTVARSDGNSWLGDNLLTAALWQAVEAKLSLPAIPSESAESSKLEPDIGVLFIGSDGLGKALGAAKPSSGWRLSVWPVDGEESSREAREEIISQTHSVLVLEREVDSATLRALQQITWSESPIYLKLNGANSTSRPRLCETLQSRGFVGVEQVEWMAMEACANFAFWTGVAPSLDSIRESLEEYLQW